MSPLAVVEDLQVLEQLRARPGPRRSRSVADEFDLERGEEAPDDPVAPAVAPATHAADHALPSQYPAVLVAGVLTLIRNS